ncbi:DUF2255 family protein [Pseudomonas baltica]|uniref:DUF2255 family protein n=1 Tax=Pseudomonas baltica TaxID=2762576 RepID=A0A7X1KSQ9_9PSED|nr:DUF2255 family protein [Pseudomonas baltica]MBC2677762.1 DUF2255 family protein [Pseudomonas baltica]
MNKSLSKTSVAVVFLAVLGCAPNAFAAEPVTRLQQAASQPAPGVQHPAWKADELQRIIKADDLKVSPFREDGVTYGTPTWIWCVEVDGKLYVRAYSGTSSSWYNAAVREKAGRIIAAGMTREVTFAPEQGSVNQRIDEAYSQKYSSSPYLQGIIGEQARSATVVITPKAQ